jgi:hypothetical protein
MSWACLDVLGRAFPDAAVSSQHQIMFEYAGQTPPWPAERAFALVRLIYILVLELSFCFQRVLSVPSTLGNTSQRRLTAAGLGQHLRLAEAATPPFSDLRPTA